MKMNRIGHLILLLTLIIQVSCSPMTSYPEEISNYEKFGSNTYSVFNVDAGYLNKEDSKCVTRSESISIDDEIKNKTITECVEVNNLHSDRGKMFFNLIDSFFNSGSGMMFISGLLELL